MRVGSRWVGGLRVHLAEEDTGKAGRALALSLLTLLAATVAGMEGHASLEAARSTRLAEQIALSATGESSSNVIQVGAAYGIYRRWYEELERSAWASSEAVKAGDPDEAARLRMLQAIDAEVAAWITTQSPLLQTPLYDPAARVSDFGAFEAEAIVRPAVEAYERRAAELAVAAAWGARASAYVTALTVIAVGLFFVGLAGTVASGRRFLAGAGLAFGLVAAAWVVTVALGPIHRVPDAAIGHLAASNAALTRAPLLSGSEAPPPAALAWYQTAIDEASAAIGLDAGYDSAYQIRGGARIHYADELILSGIATTVDTATLLRDGIGDLRRYLEDHPDDYAAWWNVGWASYLVGDNAASTEATDRALELAPGQFTLYLNRSLARLAGGDVTGAGADVDRALELAAADTTDTASWYLGQSDFDIGRLAELRPDQADFLLSTQLRLREAQVALRTLGSPVPDATAPSPDAVTVRAIDIGRYSGGIITPGEALPDLAHVSTADVVGVRVTVDGAALDGRHLSARIWRNGLPRLEFARDVVATGATTELDLMSPYGRAGFDLEPGSYTLDVYVDGSRRFTSAWTVDPRVAQPAFKVAASELVGQLRADNFTCTESSTGDAGSVTACTGHEDVGRLYFVNVTADALDRITVIAATARATEGGDPIEVVAPPLFRYLARALYPDDLAARAQAWIDDQGVAVADLELGGTTLRVFGANATDRSIDIFAVWPAGEGAT